VCKACTQAVPLCACERARVCVRVSARVQWRRTRANACAAAVCVPPFAGMQTCEPCIGTFASPFSSPCIIFGFFADWASTREAATCGTIETTSVRLVTSYG
jgi:hypothetical protein